MTGYKHAVHDQVRHVPACACMRVASQACIMHCTCSMYAPPELHPGATLLAKRTTLMLLRAVYPPPSKPLHRKARADPDARMHMEADARASTRSPPSVCRARGSHVCQGRALLLSDRRDARVAAGVLRDRGDLLDHRRAGREGTEEAAAALRQAPEVLQVAHRLRRGAAVQVVVAAGRVDERAARPREALLESEQLAAARRLGGAGHVGVALDEGSWSWGRWAGWGWWSCTSQERCHKERRVVDKSPGKQSRARQCGRQTPQKHTNSTPRQNMASRQTPCLWLMCIERFPPPPRYRMCAAQHSSALQARTRAAHARTRAAHARTSGRYCYRISWHNMPHHTNAK